MDRKTQTEETILPNFLIRSWEKTLLETARCKGLSRDSSDDEKLRVILRAETSNIKSLWEAFTTDRQNLPRYLLDPKKQNTSYLLGFHLSNCARTWNLLSRTSSRTNFMAATQQYKGIKIFDLGCGTGAIGQTIFSFIQVKKSATPVSSISLIDTQGPFLDSSRLGYDNLGYTGPIKSKKAPIENSLNLIQQQIDSEHLNIIALGYVWNELAKNPKARRKFIDFMMELNDSPCLILCLEPANQQIARSAMELRDDLCLLGQKPLYPCISAEPCPMLEKPKDWCYSETTWKQPKLMKTLDKQLDINRSKLKYSGYALATKGFHDLIQEPFKHRYPVVGRPTLKGRYETGFEYLICQGQQLGKISSKATGKKVLNRGELYIEKASK